MRIDVTATPLSNKGINVLTLSHKGESQNWDVSVYDRASFTDMASLFDAINAYWETLSNTQQTQIWMIYKKITTILENGREALAIHVAIQDEVRKLYDLMPYESIKHWVDFYGNVRMPVTVKEGFGVDDLSGDEYQRSDMKIRTYLRKDYQDLAIMAIALRPMIPIWGEYINRTEEHHGKQHKEYFAMGLLAKSYLINSMPMARLTEYVNSWVKAQVVSHSAILDGLGTAELPGWVLARCIVRRVAFGEINALDETTSIIANVYRFINSMLKSMDRSFGGKVNEKGSSGGAGEDGDNSSQIENYKVKQEFPDGDLIAHIVYTENVLRMGECVDNTVPIEIMQATLSMAASIVSQPISQHQIVLTQWIMAPVMRPRAIRHLTKPALLRAMAVTQAVLWHWGFYNLAALVMVVEKPTQRDSMFTSLEGRGRIPKEQTDRLTELYPHYRRARGKDRSVRQLNVATRAIDAFCELVVHTDWIMHCAPELINHVQRYGNTNRMVVPTDIRTELSDLMIRLATR